MLHQTPWWLIPLVALSFAVSGPASKVALQDLDSNGVVFFRCIIAGVLLVPLLYPVWSKLSRSARMMAFFAGAVFAIHLISFVAAIHFTSFVSVMTLVALEPVLLVLIGIIFFGERASQQQVAGVFAAVVGTVIVAGQSYGGSTPVKDRWMGDLFALVAVGLYGLYYSLNRALKKRVNEQEVSGFALAAMLYLSGALTALPLWIAFGGTRGLSFMSWHAQTYYALGVLGIVPTLIGHSLYQIATRRLSPAWVAMTSPGEAVGSIVVGMLLFDSLPSFMEFLGGTAIVSGAVAVALAEGKAKRATAPNARPDAENLPG